MKYFIFLVLCLGLSIVNAQVGIGTITPETYSMLTIANPDGVNSPLVIKGTIQRTDLGQVIVIDPTTGETGYRNYPTGSGLITSIQNISEWRASPIDITATGTYLDNNIDLGISRTITVPANTTSIISIHYSVPIELLSATNQATAGAGVYVLKDGTKMPYSESSFSLRDVNDHGMAQLYIPDWIPNPNPTPLNVTYDVRGYLNQESNAGTSVFRFRRHDSDITLNKNRGTEYFYIRILNAQ